MTGRTKRPGRKLDRPRGVEARNAKPLVRGRKAAGARACRVCGLVQQAGTWRSAVPEDAGLAPGLCPACKRIRDGYPAGTIRLDGRFAAQAEEIRRIARNVERAEREEHPLERLMGVEESAGELVITTTGVHVARQIAHAIARRFHRKARLRYADREDLVRVEWD